MTSPIYCVYQAAFLRPVNYGKHARLLQDVALDTRSLAALQAERRPLGADFSNVTETEKVMTPFL